MGPPVGTNRASPRTTIGAACGPIVIGADTTLANAVGNPDRKGLVSKFALPSRSVVISRANVCPAGSETGTVIDVSVVVNLLDGKYCCVPSGNVTSTSSCTPYPA